MMIWRVLTDCGIDKAESALNELERVVEQSDARCFADDEAYLVGQNVKQLAGQLAELTAEARRAHRETQTLMEAYLEIQVAAIEAAADEADTGAVSACDARPLGTASAEELVNLRRAVLDEQALDRLTTNWCGRLDRCLRRLHEKLEGEPAPAVASLAGGPQMIMTCDDKARFALLDGLVDRLVDSVSTVRQIVDHMNIRSAEMRTEGNGSMFINTLSRLEFQGRQHREGAAPSPARSGAVMYAHAQADIVNIHAPHALTTPPAAA